MLREWSKGTGLLRKWSKGTGLLRKWSILHRMTTESGAVTQDKITSGVQLVVLVSLAPQYIKASEQE